MIPDSIHAHAMGVLLSEPIAPVDQTALAGELWMEGKLTLQQATERALDHAAERVISDAQRIADRTAERAAHTAALGPVDWVRRATEYEQAMTLARQANQGLAADLDHMAKLLAVAQKSAERWLIEAQENAEMAKTWRARAIAAERKR